MSDSRQVSTGGIGFSGLLTVLFIGLKLGGIIHWSWFWVLSPLIFSTILGILFLIVILIIWDLNER